MMMRSLVAATLFGLAACVPSKEVRTLSARTAPFVVTTHASVPAVEQAFAAQSARASEETSLYDHRQRAAKRRSEPIELYWSLSRTEPDKRSTALLERVRAHDASILAPPAAAERAAVAGQRASPSIGNITKLTTLLADIEKGKAGGFDFLLSFSQESWKELEKLGEDAEDEATATRE